MNALTIVGVYFTGMIIIGLTQPADTDSVNQIMAPIMWPAILLLMLLGKILDR